MNSKVDVWCDEEIEHTSNTMVPKIARRDATVSIAHEAGHRFCGVEDERFSEDYIVYELAMILLFSYLVRVSAHHSIPQRSTSPSPVPSIPFATRELSETLFGIPTADDPSRDHTDSLKNHKLKGLVIEDVSDWFEDGRHH